MLENFPKDHGQEREDLILQFVKDGKSEHTFTKISHSENGHTIDLLVFNDALKIDGVRINVTAKTQQQISDLLDCILPTAKIYDLIWHYCPNKLTPQPRQITSITTAMIEHSTKVDAEIDKLGIKGQFVCNYGKSWCIDNWLVNKPNRAVNYGWAFNGGTCKGIRGEVCASGLKDPKTSVPWRVIQGRSTVHTPDHVDYSQICLCVSKKCWVDGFERSIIDVLQDPVLSKLINHDGVLKALRQPGVEQLGVLVSENDFYLSLAPEDVKETPVSIPPADLKSEISSVPISLNPSFSNPQSLTKKSNNIFELILSIISALFNRK
jgi:hypothetical protein